MSNGETVVDGAVVVDVVDVAVDVDVDDVDDVDALELLVDGSDVVVDVAGTVEVGAAEVVDARPASASSCSNWLSARS